MYLITKSHVTPFLLVVQKTMMFAAKMKEANKANIVENRFTPILLISIVVSLESITMNTERV